MTERHDLERLLRAHLASEANDAPSRGQLNAVIARVGRTGQRPRAYASLTSDGRIALDPETRLRLGAAAVLLATAALLALAFVALIAGGQRKLGVEPSPSASLSVAFVVPTPAATGQPSPSPLAPDGDSNCKTMDAIATELGATSVNGNPWAAGRQAAPPSVRPGPIAVLAERVAGQPDGGPWDLVSVDPTTGDRTTLLPLGIDLSKYSSLAWAPDGSALEIGLSSDCGSEGMFVWTPDGVYRMEPKGTYGVNEERGQSAWSPDGSQLAVVVFGPDQNEGTTISVLDRVTGGVRDLPTACQVCSVFDFRWSPDGRRIAALYERFDAQPPDGNQTELGVAIVDVETGEWIVIPAFDGGEAMLGWRDNRLVLAIGGQHGDTVLGYGIDGRRAQAPSDGTGALLLLPGGQQVITTARLGSGRKVGTEIGLLNLVSGARQSLYTSAKGIELGGGILAPDGSAAAFSSYEGDTPATVVIQLDGSGSKVLPGVDLSSGAWQPSPQP